MALPVTYNIRSVFVRWRTTGFTVLGVTLVVAVYVLLSRWLRASSNPAATPATRGTS